MNPTKKDADSTKQLELEFDSKSGQKNKHGKAKIIDLAESSRRILTSQALKATKSF